MKYLLDTNVLMHWVNKSDGHDLIDFRIASMPSEKMAISAITVWEVSRMVEKAKVSARSIQALLAAVSLFPVIVLDEQIAALGGSLSGRLSNLGISIGDRDSMIAATAMSRRLVMVTDNVKEFARVPGLPVENWRKP